MSWFGKPQVAEEPTYRLCRGEHVWRVTHFDYLAARITETCTACGERRERVIEAASRPRKGRGRK